jgi:hypothetical protein
MDHFKAFLLYSFLGHYTISAISAIMAYVCEDMVKTTYFPTFYDSIYHQHHFSALHETNSHCLFSRFFCFIFFFD